MALFYLFYLNIISYYILPTYLPTILSLSHSHTTLLSLYYDTHIIISYYTIPYTIHTYIHTLLHYLTLPQKKHPSIETYRIKAWLKTSLAKRFISTIRSSDFAVRRDARIKDGMSPASIKLEFAIISHLYFVARAEWGFDGLENPIRYLRMPKLPRGRTRRVSDEELHLVIQHTDSFDLPYIVKLAIETGMRRGEIAKLTWKDVDMMKRTAHLMDTKNGEDRLVPLSIAAISVLKSLPTRIDGRMFGMTAHAITYAFIRATKRAGIKDLHFHDLRHEAITRLFEKGFNVMEVGSISGHKTLQMLQRYTHLRAENFLERLG